jgi:acylphosphatase
MGSSDTPRELGSPALGQLYDDLLPMARRTRSRPETVSRRFITRSQPRAQWFVERWQLIIEGRVQGVGFRSSCSRRALDLGLKGWVRNRREGSIEVQVEGSPHAIAELRAWTEQGPPGARVKRVKPSQLPVTGEDWFEVRP